MTEPGGQSTTPALDAITQRLAVNQPLAVRRAAMRTAALGIAYSVLYLFTVLFIKSRLPPIGASDQEVISFYSDSNERRAILFAGLYLVPFTGIAFIWFIVTLRMWVTASASRENVLFSNVQLVSGIIFTALFFVAGASMSVTAATVELSDGPIDPLVARQFPQYGSMILLVFAMRMAAMFVLATSTITRTTGILPKWFAYLSIVMALGLLLSVSLSPWLVIVFPTWVLVCCAMLLDRARRIPRDLVISGPDLATERLSSGPAVPR